MYGQRGSLLAGLADGRRAVTLLLAALLVVPLAVGLTATPAAAQVAERPGADDGVLQVLLFTKQAGHNPAAPVAAVRDAATTLAAEDGQTAEFTETGDAAIFTTAQMDTFDAVVFVHTGGPLFNQAQRDGLEAYIQAGGGYMGIHYAGWSRGPSEHDEWNWYHDLVGAASEGHPEIQAASVVAPDPAHPLVADLDAETTWTDEFYDWVVNPADNVRTLLEVDESTIANYRDPADNYDGRRHGTTHPVTWCQAFDGGRSWYTSLGHASDYYDDPFMQDMLSHGLEYTAGLVQADCTPPTKDVNGAFSDVTPWPLVPINASLTGEGLVQSFGSVITGNDPTPYAWDGNGPVYQGGQFETDVWDPADERSVDNVYDDVVPNTTYTDLFCSIQVYDPTSRSTLTAGGDDGLGGNAPNDGSMGTTSYSSGNGLQAEAPMLYPRWYPTATALPNGDIVVQGGAVTGAAGPGVLTPEIYTPDDGPGWRALTGATSELAYGDVGGNGQGNDENRWWYPRAWVAPGSGTLYNLSGTQSFELDPSGDGQIIDRGAIPADIRSQGALGNPVGATSTAVMYAPGKILQVGGGAWSNGGGPDGARAGFTVDITGGTDSATFAATDPMDYQRHWATSTVLPDGDVLVSGGGRTNNGRDGVITNPEIWDPETGTWTTVEVPQEHARLYHSTALLLPDGRVMIGGGGTPGPWNYTDVEYYSPAYLFDGDELAPRPVVTDAPDEIGYAGTFDLAVDSDVSRVTLVRNGSVTHGFNNDQRFQDLTFTTDGEGTLTVDAPQDGTYAPPGAYMVFAFDETGTPSEAAMLHIDPEVEMDHRTPDVVEQFSYPRIPSPSPAVVTVEPGDGRMAPWTIDSTVELVHGTAPDMGGLERVGQHLALGESGSLSRTIEDLEPGREYRVSLRHARDSRAPGEATATLSIGDLDATLAPTIDEVTDGSPTTFAAFVGTFTANARTEELTLAGTGTGSVVVDNLVIIGTDPGVDDGPIHYAFDEGEGTTAANTGTDSSTGAATLAGATGWTDQGVFGAGLDLPGGSLDDGNFVDLPDDLLADATDFSVSMWANADQLSAWTGLFHIGNGTDGYFQIQSNTQTAGPTGLAATFKAPGAALEERVLLGQEADLTPGEWTHVAFTREGATGTLYVDGLAVASRDDLTISLSDIGATSDNWLGRNGFPDDPFQGLMDEVRAWTTALTAQDVAVLYSDGSALRTTTTVTVAPESPSPFGEPVTVAADVTDVDGQPAQGDAELWIDGARVGTPLALQAGGATFPAVQLSPGDHEVEVRFLAAEGWRDSTATVAHTVDRPPVGEGVPIHYTFDEGAGTTAANSGVDPSIGEATLEGSTGWASGPDGRYGSAVSLPGGASTSGNFVDLPDDITAGMDEAFSVSMWTRPDALPNWVPLLQIGSSTDTFFLLQSSTLNGSGGFGATFKQAGNPTQERLTLGAGNDLPLDEWTHVVFTMSGSNGRIYFDGELVGERTDFPIGIDDVGIDGTTTANFVGNTSWPDPMFDGLVDDLRMYAYELGADDVVTLFEGDTSAVETTTTVTVDPASPSDWAEPVTVSASVEGADGDPAEGQAQLWVDDVAAGDAVAVEAGLADFTVDELIPGPHELEVRFTGAAGWIDSVGSASHTVDRPDAQPGVPIHYTFDEGAGTTAGNTGSDPAAGPGTLEGAAGWADGPDAAFSSAVSLPGGPSGDGNYVDLPDNLMWGLEDEFTVSMWARPDALPNWVPLFQVGSSTDTYFLLQSSTNANGPTGFAATFKQAGNADQERLTLGGGNDLPLDEWTHVTFTMGGSTGRIYFDGELVGERTDFTLGLGDVGIGGTTTANFLGNTSWPDPTFDGVIDDLRIYGQALAPEQVVALAQGDLAAPTVTTTLNGGQDAAGDFVDSATVTITADDADGAGVAVLQYALDGGDFVDYEAPVVVNDLGDHTVLVRATDAVGNRVVADPVAFTIVEQTDTAAPTIDVTGVTDGAILGDSEVVRLTAQASDDDTGVTEMVVTLDGVVLQRDASTSWQADLQLWELDLGPHTLAVSAVDAAGNTADVALDFAVETSILDVLIHLDRLRAEDKLGSKQHSAIVKRVETADRWIVKGKPDKAVKELQRARSEVLGIGDASARRLLDRDLTALIGDLDDGN